MQLESLRRLRAISLREVLTAQEKQELGELLQTGSEVLKKVLEAEAANCHFSCSSFAQEINPQSGQFRSAEATEEAIKAWTYQNALSVLESAVKD
jgi:hypothetical protein